MADNFWDKLMGTDEGAASYMATYGEGPGSDTRHLIGSFINDGESLLDVGCGPGWNYDHFKEYGPKLKRYLGLDYSERFIRVADKRQPDAHWAVADCRDLPIQDRTFDVVLLQDCLEHTNGYKKPIEEAMRVATSRVLITFWKASFMDGEDSADQINDDGDEGYGSTYNRVKFEEYLDSLGVEWHTATTEPGANRWHRIYALELNDES